MGIWTSFTEWLDDVKYREGRDQGILGPRTSETIQYASSQDPWEATQAGVEWLQTGGQRPGDSVKERAQALRQSMLPGPACVAMFPLSDPMSVIPVMSGIQAKIGALMGVFTPGSAPGFGTFSVPLVTPGGGQMVSGDTFVSDSRDAVWMRAHGVPESYGCQRFVSEIGAQSSPPPSALPPGSPAVQPYDIPYPEGASYGAMPPPSLPGFSQPSALPPAKPTSLRWAAYGGAALGVGVIGYLGWRALRKKGKRR